MRLVVTAHAAHQIREADDWWAENRLAAPGLLRIELNRAFELIRSQPSTGAVAENIELPGVRRVLLRRTRYHLYYKASRDLIEILALWHARRGQAPEL